MFVGEFLGEVGNKDISVGYFFVIYVGDAEVIDMREVGEGDGGVFFGEDDGFVEVNVVVDFDALIEFGAFFTQKRAKDLAVLLDGGVVFKSEVIGVNIGAVDLVGGEIITREVLGNFGVMVYEEGAFDFGGFGDKLGFDGDGVCEGDEVTVEFEGAFNECVSFDGERVVGVGGEDG